MEQLIQDFGRMYRERNDLLKEVTRAHHETLLRLAMAAEFKRTIEIIEASGVLDQ